MSDSIGAQRVRVRLQRPTPQADAMGGAALGWTDAGDVWANVTQIAADSRVAFDALRAVARHSVIMRRRSDVRSGWRVLRGAAVLRVVAVRDQGEPRLELICEEEET